MYRILREHGEVGTDRRRQATHPPRAVPELVADAPNRVWAWDITKLRGPDKGLWYCLYTIIDLFSRYVVGWMVASRESADLARHLDNNTLRWLQRLPWSCSKPQFRALNRISERDTVAVWPLQAKPGRNASG